MLLYCPEHLKYSCENGVLSKEDFYSELNRRLFERICSLQSEGGFDIAMLSESFSQEEISKAAGMVEKRRVLSNNSKEAFLDAVAELKKEAEKIKNRGSQGDLEAFLESRRNENK